VLDQSQKRLAILVSLTFFILGALWAVSSPPGSSPDDDFHLTSIWCAWGPREGVCTTSDEQPESVAVPAAVVDASGCYRGDAEASASCTATLSTEMVETFRFNSGLYPDVFYRSLAAFVGPEVVKSVVAMRLVNVTLGALLVWLLAMLAPLTIRRSALFAYAVLLVPFGAFLIASTNPSGWAIMGAASYWAFLLTWVQRGRLPRSSRVLAFIGLCMSAIMLIGSRGDAALLASVSTFAVFIVSLSGRSRGLRKVFRNPATWIPGLIVAGAGALTFALTSQVSEASSGVWPAGQPHGLTPIALLSDNFQEFPRFIFGFLGDSALGWLDTPLPAFVTLVGSLMLGVSLVLATQDFWLGKAVALTLLMLFVLAPPLFILQANSYVVTGGEVQARYLLPPFLTLLGVSLLTRGSSIWPLTKSFRLVFSILLAASGGLAIWTNSIRYAADDGWTLFPWSRAGVLAVAATLVGYLFYASVTQLSFGVREPDRR